MVLSELLVVKEEPSLTPWPTSFPSPTDFRSAISPTSYTPSTTLAQEVADIHQILQLRSTSTSTTPSTAAAAAIDASTVDYSPSLKLAKEINEINQINQIGPSPVLPTTTSSTTVHAGISTLLAQKSSTAPGAPVSPILSASAAPATSASLSTASTTLSPPVDSLPRLQCPPSLRSESGTDEEELLSPNLSRDLLLSPPLSQESYDGFGSHYPPLHPFDRSSSPPKKTLNWVNALPSHFDASSPCHPRKRRRRTNREELEILEDAFARNLLPDAATRQELGARLGMSVRAVQIWFQNRRQTLRKKSITSSAHTGSEEDLSRSDGERMVPSARSDRQPSSASSRGNGLPLNIGSRSCSDLGSSTHSDLKVDTPTLLRAETCSSLPTVMAMLLPALAPTLSASLEEVDQKVALPREASPTVKQEMRDIGHVTSGSRVEEESASLEERAQDILDAKTAELHLTMLLQEAKKRSGQQGATPVMALWRDTPSKPVLNASGTCSIPEGTTHISVPARPASAPSLKSPTHRSSSRSGTKGTRKHRSLPESSLSFQACAPYQRSVSLMEQVIHRQQQQQQQQIVPSSFKQSALSSSGKQLGRSSSHLASRFRHTPAMNLQRTASESIVAEMFSGTGPVVMARRARRLSIGKFLFDSDTDEEDASQHRKDPHSRQQPGQAQKRRVPAPSQTLSEATQGIIDGDETDEDDRVASVRRQRQYQYQPENYARKRSNGPNLGHFYPTDFGRQDWSASHKTPRKNLKSTMTALTTTPTREYGLSLEQSQGPMSYPILERNRTWSSAVVDPSAAQTNPTLASADPAVEPPCPDTKDLNLDELECASVLAGLGWGR